MPFDVAAGAPMAEAGKAIRVAQGRTVTLDGTSSKAGVAGGRLTYQWQLVQGPAGVAHAVLPPGSNASFRLSQPGDYLMRLTVTERQGSSVVRSTDLVGATAIATTATMGEPIATFTPDPKDQSKELGLTLGETWYPWSKYFAGKTAGVFAVDARTLKFPVGSDEQAVTPVGFDNNIAGGAALVKFLGQLSGDQLLVLMFTDGYAGQYSSRIVGYNGPRNGSVGYALTDGTVNQGLTTGDGEGGLLKPGGLSGYLRYSTTDGTTSDAGPYASGLFRFVQDDQITYSTSTSRVATGGIADGATYQLAVPSGYDQANQVVGRTDEQQPAVLQQPDSGLGQQWELRRVYGDYFELVDRAGGCLNLSGTDGRSVLVWPCTGRHEANELWTVETDASTRYQRLRSAQRPLNEYDAARNAASYLSRDGSGRLVVSPLSSADHGQLWTWRIPAGLYTITGAYNGKAVAEPDYAKKVGDQLVSAAVSGELAQQWRVVPRQGDEFGLQNVASGLCMTVADNGVEGARIARSTCDANDAAQDWAMATTADGVYLQSGEGKYLGADKNGKLVHQGFDAEFPVQSQPLWTLSRQPEPVVGGAYALANVNGTLHVSADGKDAGTEAAEQAQARQDWVVREASTTRPGTGLVQLYQRTTNVCLGRSTDTVRSSEAVIRPCGSWEDGGTTTWRLDPRPDGGYRVAAVAKDKTLTSDLTGTPGALLVTARRDDSAADDHRQQWQLAGRAVTMRLGGDRWTSSLPAGTAGFVVMATDAASRQVAGYPRSYWTNGTSGNQPDQRAMADDLKKLGQQAGVTVMVQSIGRPWPTTDIWNAMADGIGAVHLSRQPFLELTGKGDYAGVGCGQGCTGSQPWVSEAVRREIDPGLLGVHLEGTLRRNENAVFVGDGAASVLDSTFSSLANRTTRSWPLSDTTTGLAALNDLATRLSLPTAGSCGGDPKRNASDPGLDAVRNNYCLLSYDQARDWTKVLVDLKGQSYSQNAGYDENTFLVAKAQLSVEFGQLSQVHTMMQGIRNFYRDSNGNGVWNKDAATKVADAISSQLPTKRVTDRPSAGGWIAFTADTLDLLKTLKPLLLAAPHGGEAAEPEKEKFEAGDAVISALTLAGDIVDLAGDNDSKTVGIDNEIDTTAAGYAKELSDQADGLVQNLLTVENIVVTDPVKLEVAAGSSDGEWSLKTPEATSARETMRAGLSRNIWLRLFPTAYELWMWPSLTYEEISPTDIVCNKDTLLGVKWHHLYTGTDADAVYQPPKTLRSNGTPSGLLNVWVLTPVEMQEVSVDEDRTLSAGLRSAVAAGTGYGRKTGDAWRIAAATEFLADVPLTRRTYPGDMDLSGTGGSYPCAQLNPATGAIDHF